MHKDVARRSGVKNPESIEGSDILIPPREASVEVFVKPSRGKIQEAV